MNEDHDTFLARVEATLREIMLHVSRCESQFGQRGYSTNCVDPEHAKAILDREGMVVYNRSTIDQLFDYRG